MLYSRKALLAFIAAAAISTTPGCECEDPTSPKPEGTKTGGGSDKNTQGGKQDDQVQSQTKKTTDNTEQYANGNAKKDKEGNLLDINGTKVPEGRKVDENGKLVEEGPTQDEIQNHDDHAKLVKALEDAQTAAKDVKLESAINKTKAEHDVVMADGEAVCNAIRSKSEHGFNEGCTVKHMDTYDETGFKTKCDPVVATIPYLKSKSAEKKKEEGKATTYDISTEKKTLADVPTGYFKTRFSDVDTKVTDIVNAITACGAVKNTNTDNLVLVQLQHGDITNSEATDTTNSSLTVKSKCEGSSSDTLTFKGCIEQVAKQKTLNLTLKNLHINTTGGSATDCVKNKWTPLFTNLKTEVGKCAFKKTDYDTKEKIEGADAELKKILEPTFNAWQNAIAAKADADTKVTNADTALKASKNADVYKKVKEFNEKKDKSQKKE